MYINAQKYQLLLSCADRNWNFILFIGNLKYTKICGAKGITNIFLNSYL